MAAKPCRDCEKRPKMPGKQRCGWCYIDTLPIMSQIAIADRRLARLMADPGFAHRARVPASEWPPGTRWCGSCQSFVPLEYARGSRCRACASRAAHATRIKATYQMSGEEYDALYRWQGGRCYICGKRTKMRLAVDHDHRTGEVRGLLCANDEWGCNMSLRIVLNDLEIARQLFRYVQLGPFTRMKNGEPPPSYEMGDPPPM